MFGWQNLHQFIRSQGGLIGSNIGFAILFLLIRRLLRGIPVRSGERLSGLLDGGYRSKVLDMIQPSPSIISRRKDGWNL
jgi:hypothetical protein